MIRKDENNKNKTYIVTEKKQTNEDRSIITNTTDIGVSGISTTGGDIYIKPSSFLSVKEAETFIEGDLDNITISTHDLSSEIEYIFNIAHGIHFEDGMENRFSIALTAFIKEHGKIAIKQLKHFLEKNKPDPQILAEGLRWIGEIDHKSSHELRRLLLEEYLYNISPHIRDGALIGLEHIEDTNTIPALVQAIAKEKFLSLKNDMEKFLNQLKADVDD